MATESKISNMSLFDVSWNDPLKVAMDSGQTHWEVRSLSVLCVAAQER